MYAFLFISNKYRMANSQTFQRSKVFKDFDLSFSKNPVTNDISLKTDVNAINQSIKSLLNTNFYERFFQPKLGSNIKKILFEPADVITISDLKQAISDTISNHEPRVTISSIEIQDQSDRNAYFIRLIYKINNKEEPVVLSVVLERLR